jgi:hypothetical protein
VTVDACILKDTSEDRDWTLSGLNDLMTLRGLWRTVLRPDPHWQVTPPDMVVSAKTSIHQKSLWGAVGAILKSVDGQLVKTLIQGISFGEYSSGEGARVLEEHLHFSEEDGVLLADTSGYMKISGAGEEYLTFLGLTDQFLCGHNAMFGRMLVVVSRHMPRDTVLFVPRTVGRYTDKLEALHPRGDGVDWTIRLSMSGDVNSSQVRGVRFREV